MNTADIIFGTCAFVGVSIFILSLIIGLIHDIHRLWTWLTTTPGQKTMVRGTMEEMYDSTPYAASRNARQALTKGGKRGA